MQFFGDFKEGSMEARQTRPHFLIYFFCSTISKSTPILCCPLFSEYYLNTQARTNKMVNKHTVDYYSSPSQLISRTCTFLFLRFIFPESFLNFFLDLYISPWLQESFKFIVLRLLQIHLWVKKLNLFIFTHAPKKNLPPSFYHYLLGRGELPILSA